MKFLVLIALGIVTTLAIDSQLLKEFNDGYNQFVAKVYKELLKTNPENFLVCPLSADIVLALLQDGAEGETGRELRAGLHLPQSKDKIRQIFRALSPHLQGNKDYTLSSANKIYIKHEFEIKEEFNSTAVEVFAAEVQNINFEDTAAAAFEINHWVEEKTHEKIKELIKSNDLNEDTRAVLINAMYFHAKWEKEFNSEHNVNNMPFFLNNKDHMPTDMMYQQNQFNYFESSDLNAKFLEMPYKGGDVTMTIVLSNDKEGLSALEARIDDVITAPRYNTEKVNVWIPKFKTETNIKFESILKTLGIREAFRETANFCGVSEEPIKIESVIQKTFIEVAEEGTTAAAATAVIARLGVKSIEPEEDPPKYFAADHPFIYYLKSSAGIMFIGRFTKP